MGRYTYPHTIENGAGERITFLRAVPRPGGDRLEVENVVAPGAGQGETVAFKPGDAHKFWNAGEDDLRWTGHIEPAGSVEYLLTELFASMKRRGTPQPDPFDAALLMWRYRDEFTLLEIPALVRRFVLPAQVAVGTLLGKYRKYADAPGPVRG